MATVKNPWSSKDEEKKIKKSSSAPSGFDPTNILKNNDNTPAKNYVAGNKGASTGGTSLSATVYIPGVQKIKTPTAAKPTVSVPSVSSGWATSNKLIPSPAGARAEKRNNKLSYELPTGRLPTTSEALARIATLAQTDMVAADSAYKQLQALQADASSPYYAPYATPSNWKALQELGNLLGQDLSGGVDDQWMTDWAHLLDNPRYTATGITPAAPTKKSSAEEDAAYWYYQLQQAQEGTAAAEMEWQALKDDIAYLVNDPRSYSDEEILARIDASSYSTLNRLLESRDKKNPVKLNRALDYSEEAILGAIWAARNDGGTGNSLWDAANSTLGLGNRYRPDGQAIAARDPNSDRYNPNEYTTLSDEARYFGVDSFSWDWVNANRDLLESPVEETRKNYQKVYGSMATMDAIEAEWTDAQETVNYLVGRGYSDDQIRAAVEGKGYSTLKKLDEGREANKPLALPQGTTASLKQVDGLIWAARNGGGTGDALEDTRRYNAGAGTMYRADPLLEKMRTPGTPEYNPYFESNVHDVLQYFGVDTLNRDILNQLQPQLGDGNQTTQKMFSKAVAAVENAEAAERQVAALWSTIEEVLPFHSDAEELLAEVAFNEDWEGSRTRKGEYGTLWKMDDSRYVGDPVMLGYGVDYRWEDVVKQVEALVAVKEESASAVTQYATYEQLFQKAADQMKGSPLTGETIFGEATRQATAAYKETPLGRTLNYYAGLANGTLQMPEAGSPLSEAEDGGSMPAPGPSAPPPAGWYGQEVEPVKEIGDRVEQDGGGKVGSKAAPTPTPSPTAPPSKQVAQPGATATPTASGGFASSEEDRIVAAEARQIEMAQEQATVARAKQDAKEALNAENATIASSIAQGAASVTPEEKAALQTFFVAANGHPEEAAAYIEKSLWRQFTELVYGTENVKAFTEADERRLAYLEKWAAENPELAQKSTGFIVDANAKELRELTARKQAFSDAMRDAPTYQDVIHDFYAKGDNTSVVDALVTGLHIYSSFDYDQIFEYMPYALSNLDDARLYDVFRQQLPDEPDRIIQSKVGQVNTMRQSITRLYASPVPSNEADGWLQQAGQLAVDTIKGEGSWARASLNADMDLRTLNQLAVNDMFDMTGKAFMGIGKLAATGVGYAADVVGAGEAWDALEERYIDSEIQAANARLEASGNLLAKYGSNTDVISYTIKRDLGKAMMEMDYVSGITGAFAGASTAGRAMQGLEGAGAAAKELPRILYGLQSGGATVADLSQREDLTTLQWFGAGLANGATTWAVTRLGVEDKLIARMTGLSEPETAQAVLNMGIRKYVSLYGHKGLKLVGTVAQGFMGEYAEEALEEAISGPLTNVITGDEQPSAAEYFKGIHSAGFQGGITGMLMAGIAYSAATPVDSRTHRELVRLTERVDKGETITVGDGLRMLGMLPAEYAKTDVQAEIVSQATDMAVSDRMMDMVAEGATDAMLTAPIHQEVADLEADVQELQTTLNEASAAAERAAEALQAVTLELLSSLENQADPAKGKAVMDATKAQLKTQERYNAVERDLNDKRAEFERKAAMADALGKQTMHDLREAATRSLAEEAQAREEARAQEAEGAVQAEARAREEARAAQAEEVARRAQEAKDRAAHREEAQARYDDARAENKAAYKEFTAARSMFEQASDSLRKYADDNGSEVGGPDDTAAYEGKNIAYQRYLDTVKVLRDADAALETAKTAEAEAAQAAREMPETLPEDRAEARPRVAPEATGEASQEAGAEGRQGVLPEDRPGARPVVAPEASPVARQEGVAERVQGVLPEDRPGTRPIVAPETAYEAQAEAALDTRQSVLPEDRPGARPQVAPEVATAEVRDEVAADARQGVLPEDRASARPRVAPEPTQAQDRTERRQEVRPEDRAEARPVVAPETSDGVLYASMPRVRTSLSGDAANRVKAETVSNPIQISRRLAQKLEVGEYFGAKRFNYAGMVLPKTMEGYYAEHRNVAVTRNAADFDTNIHEIGHAIMERTGMEPTADMIAGLDPVFAASYASDQIGPEAFAEFVRQYIITPEKMDGYDRQTVADFERALKNVRAYEDIRAAREEFQAYRIASDGQRMDSVVVDRATSEQKTAKERFGNFVTGLLDASRPAEAINELVREQAGENAVPIEYNVREAALMTNFDDRRAANLMTNALANPSGEIIGKSLGEVFADNGVRGKGTEFQDLSTYLLIRHSFDRDVQEKPVFDNEQFSPEARRTYMQELEAKYEHFSKAADAYDVWWQDFTKAWLVDTGFMLEETWEEFNQKYPHYVPTYRKQPNETGGVKPSRNSSYNIKVATGSSLEIYNPFDNMVTDLNRIVRMVSTNNVGVVFDRVYNEVEGMGVFARPINDIQADMGKRLEQQIKDALTEGKSGDVIQDLMRAQQENVDAMQRDMQNAVRVVRPDGSTVFYEVRDQALFDLFTRASAKNVKTGLEALGKITRGMTMLTTGSNPIFAITNAMRDFQQSVNHGSWASNYLTALPKWLKAFYDVWRGKGEYADYQAMGGGGWLRVGAESRRSADAYRADLFKGYDRRDLGSTLQYAGKKVWSGITLARLNEIVENTSRYAEYRYGKYDKTTPEGRVEAFRGSQEATVDFTRRGNSQAAQVLRQVIPFFNANAQGTYQQARDFTKQERDRAGARFTKTVMNTGLATTLAYLLRGMFLDEEDREAYSLLSADIQNGYFILPNPWEYDRRLIRIPVNQTPLARAVHGFLTQMLDSGDRDEFAQDMLTVGASVLEGMWPVNSTIADSVLAVQSNTNWYGSPIVPQSLQDKHVTMQYNATTPEAFLVMSRALNAVGVDVAPLQAQYVADQMMGWVGDLAIPALSVDRYTGEIGGMEAVVRTFANRFTIDPAYSNDVTDAFYNDRDTLDQLLKDFKPGDEVRYGYTYSNMLGRDVSPEESMQIYLEAKDLRSKVFQGASDTVNDLWAEINGIYANDSLTKNQQNILARDKRMEMVDVLLGAETQFAAFQDAYLGKSSLEAVLFGGPEVRMATAADTMAETFAGDLDAGKAYMQKAMEVFTASETSKRDSFLPHPNEKFTQDGVEYVISDSDRGEWDERYKVAYEKYVEQNGRKWDVMTLEEKQEILKKAHTAGHNAAKKWYSSSPARMRGGSGE